MSEDAVEEARTKLPHQPAIETMNYGVYVVTCRSGDRINGLTIAWATQVSMNPSLISIAVAKPWYSHELLKSSFNFVVHVLADDQVDLGKHFGYVSGRDKDKFEGLEWESGYEDVPVLKGCKAVIGCKKINEVSAGDHTIFIGEAEYSKVDESKTAQVLDSKVYFP